MSCEKCTPYKMYQEGCCVGTENVAGLGTKFLRINFKDGGKLVVPACKQFVKFEDTGKWGCGDYLNRPEICRAFECEGMQRERTEEEY